MKQLGRCSRLVDTGLVVVVCITASMIAIVVYCLLFVKYEWCHVLFKNNTVGGYCLLCFKYECCHVLFKNNMVGMYCLLIVKYEWCHK